MTLHYSAKRWQDQVILLIGVWLVISPWVFNYPISSPPAVNATIAGIIMAVLAAFDLYKTYVWAVLLNVVAGIWVTVSPWLVGAIPDRAMTASLLVSGMATVVLGVWELRSDPELHSQWTNSGATG
ncbi:SPW repeat protein [Massilia sp. ST3]|uniref:SPW repeat protein n=1 Tax=Massilia sp. ST3 TaxID=2824903 RepID=UPI001B8261F1|nr:SPW repeat protein [Massilia sp. ST3]MBQ5949457.1 SPW repeat protein [Massilia sp. ST3]